GCSLGPFGTRSETVRQLKSLGRSYQYPVSSFPLVDREAGSDHLEVHLTQGLSKTATPSITRLSVTRGIGRSVRRDHDSLEADSAPLRRPASLTAASASRAGRACLADGFRSHP